jgi:hypothetical protein
MKNQLKKNQFVHQKFVENQKFIDLVKKSSFLGYYFKEQMV